MDQTKTNLLIQKFQTEFETLLTLYNEYNSHTNISAIRNAEDIYNKHFLDSLNVHPLTIRLGSKSILDLGSGGGFPALPLAIVSKSQYQITAVDSIAKKTKFISIAKDTLKLESLQVITGRAEELAHKKPHRENYDLVLARAVAELNILLELSIPLVQVNKYFIAFKKNNNDDELKKAQNAMKQLSVKLIEQIQLGDKQLMIFQKQKPSSSVYPRSMQQIKQKPL